jgi:uncharacterized protein (DUF1330 family)
LEEKGMKGYLIGNVTVTNSEGYTPYRQAVPAIIEKFGGRYLVRGSFEQVEGRSECDRLVVIEFPSFVAAKAFYNSLEYQAIIRGRTDNARSIIMLAEEYKHPA